MIYLNIRHIINYNILSLMFNRKERTVTAATLLNMIECLVCLLLQNLVITHCRNGNSNAERNTWEILFNLLEQFVYSFNFALNYKLWSTISIKQDGGKKQSVIAPTSRSNEIYREEYRQEIQQKHVATEYHIN